MRALDYPHPFGALQLGDLLLQVVYHARIAEERGAFALAEVIEAISAKLVRRHPLVLAGARRACW